MRSIACLGCGKKFSVKNDEPDFAYCDPCEEERGAAHCEEDQRAHAADKQTVAEAVKLMLEAKAKLDPVEVWSGLVQAKVIFTADRLGHYAKDLGAILADWDTLLARRKARRRPIMVAATSSGVVNEYAFPSKITLSDVLAARSVVEEDHRRLGHHVHNGQERLDQGFAGFVTTCVPQSEARSLLERRAAKDPASVPASVLDALAKGGVDSMLLLYSLTLPRASSKKKPGGGVWLGEVEIE